MYSDDDLLMLSGIQHFAFCERQWALINVERHWAENMRTDEIGSQIPICFLQIVHAVVVQCLISFCTKIRRIFIIFVFLCKWIFWLHRSFGDT